MMHVNHSPINTFQAVLSALNSYISSHGSKIIQDTSNRRQDIKYIARLVYKYFKVPNEKIENILAFIVNEDSIPRLLPSLEDLKIKENEDEIDPLELINTISKISHYLQTIETGLRHRSDLRTKVNIALQGHEQMTSTYSQRSAFKSLLFQRLPSEDLKQLARTSHWHHGEISKADMVWKKKSIEQLGILPDNFKEPQESHMQTFFRMSASNKFYAYLTLYNHEKQLDESFVKDALSALSYIYRINNYLVRSINSIKSFNIVIGDTRYRIFNSINANSTDTHLCVGLKVCIKKQENGHFVLMPEKADKVEVWQSTQPIQTVAVIPIKYNEDKREFDQLPTLQYSASY